MIEDPRINGQEAEHPETGQSADQPPNGPLAGQQPNGPWAGQQQDGPPAPHDEIVEEAVDGLPVLAEVRTIERDPPASLPAVQAAAAAATGFVAGAATIALVKRHAARKAQRSRSAPRRAADMLPIVASRTFLVDVHLIKPQE